MSIMTFSQIQPKLLVKLKKASVHTNQIVVRFDAKQLSEVAKGQRSVCLQTEIWEVMCWSQVAALT